MNWVECVSPEITCQKMERGSIRRYIMFTGCGTALVTPFQNDFSLDEAAWRKLVRRQVEGGVHFLVPCGTTGESPTLTHGERRRVVEITLEEAHGKVPVVAGAGGEAPEEAGASVHIYTG